MQNVVRHRPGESDISVRLTQDRNRALRLTSKKNAELVADVIHMFAVLRDRPRVLHIGVGIWILEYVLDPEQGLVMYVNDPRN